MEWLQLSLETCPHMFRQYITAAVYSDKVVQQHVAPSFHARRQLTVFQKNNARLHTARIFMATLRYRSCPLLISVRLVEAENFD